LAIFEFLWDFWAVFLFFFQKFVLVKIKIRKERNIIVLKSIFFQIFWNIKFQKKFNISTCACVCGVCELCKVEPLWNGWYKFYFVLRPGPRYTWVLHFSLHGNFRIRLLNATKEKMGKSLYWFIKLICHTKNSFGNCLSLIFERNMISKIHFCLMLVNCWLKDIRSIFIWLLSCRD